MLFQQGISAEGVQLSMVVEWEFSSPFRKGGVCMRVYMGVFKNINCVCYLNKSLSSAKGEVGVGVKKVNLTLMTVFIRFKFQLSELKPL